MCQSQDLSQDFLPQPEDLRTRTPTWGHYRGWLVTWPGCRESHVDFMIPQRFRRASWAHNLLEIGPKGRANGRDGRLLRLMFETNSCKYNALSLGFQHQKLPLLLIRHTVVFAKPFLHAHWYD